MSIEELQQQTTINIQEKANLIWAIADKLVGTYKPHEYGNVILPMCVIKRFSDTLAATKQKVIDMNKTLDSRGIMVKDGFLRSASGYDFYNVSPFTFDGLLSDAENIADNFRSYLNHFSANVIDVIEKFDFDKEITKLSNNGILYNVISEFCSKKAYMGVDAISAVDMGYIFEELVRKFSESYDEHAGAHFTARDIIYLMAEILVAPKKNAMLSEGITATMYDMAMGTSQMLDCLSEKLLAINEDAQLTEFGQELNEQTFAIAKANMLIKGGDAENMKHGNTLSDDKFKGYKFDYIISNPPFGIEWKNEKAAVEAEHKKGDMGRFGAGLPAVGDSQQLFMLNGVAKLKDTGRMAIIQNGSPLFKGDAGSGESNIRGYLLENDWLEAIIQIPNDMFYNTSIATYIWIVSKDKSAERAGKVQLIDASKCCYRRRKPLGYKRNEFTNECIALIAEAYNAFANGIYSNDAGLEVEVKIKANEDFKYSKVVVEQPVCDDEGNPILKRGKPTADSSKRDTESIPWTEEIEAYMAKNVYPYAPDAWIDDKKTKIGYEIPFIKEFYKYAAPPRSEVVYASELSSLDREVSLGVNRTNLVKSDIPWIGDIPEGWSICRVKNLFVRKNEKAHQENPTVLSLARAGVKIRDISINEGQMAESYYDYNPVEPFDLLLNPMDLQSGANCSMSLVTGVISPAYVNLRAKEEACPRFYDYYFKTQYWSMAFFAHGKGISFDNRWTLGTDTLFRYNVPFPSLPEQQKIADLLDDKCSKIDEIIASQEKIIEKLKEYKKSIIYEYVTGKREVE